jgi:hypothetical protein
MAKYNKYELKKANEIQPGQHSDSHRLKLGRCKGTKKPFDSAHRFSSASA